MAKGLIKLAAGLLALAGASLGSSASAAILTEDFEAQFPAWESGWLATNSNLKNLYGQGNGRGNNPDGLWLTDGNGFNNGAVIQFTPAFGSTISSFSIDVTTWDHSAVFFAYDMNGAQLISTAITSFEGGYTNPGSYQTIAFTSTNGVSGFSILGNYIEGNTSIDNVVVETGPASVPEPASLGLLALGAAGLVAARRKKHS